MLEQWIKVEDASGAYVLVHLDVASRFGCKRGGEPVSPDILDLVREKEREVTEIVENSTIAVVIIAE